MTIGVKANSVENITFTSAGFSVISATAPFFVRYGETKEKLKVFVGQNIGTKAGPIIGAVTFINETSAQIDIVTGEIGSGVTNVPADLTGVVPVTNITNPIVYRLWDTGIGTPSPFSGTANDLIPLQSNKPFHRIWSFFSQAIFPTNNIVGLSFYLNGVQVYALHSWIKINLANFAESTEFGFTTNHSWDSSRTPTQNCMFYKSPGTGGLYDVLQPTDLYCVADSVKFVLDSTFGGAAMTGNIYAALFVQSSEVKF